jgi:hypothetical protein
MDVDQGHILLSFLWLEVAKRVVEKAIQIYELTPEQGAALKKVFLRPGDYSVHTL